MGMTATAMSLLLVLAACGTDEPPADAPADAPLPVPAETTTPAGGEETTAAMQALEDSGMGGTITIHANGEQPMLTVALTGAPAPGVHQGHIHGGTCADRTGALTPLEPITTAGGAGEATSTVALPADSLFNGNHIVIYHEAGGSPGASLVCGQLPAR
jgi:hypothetical protein